MKDEISFIDYFLKKWGITTGDYVRLKLTDGRILDGYIMPKHEYSKPNILVVKLRNGYNIGINAERIKDIEKITPPKFKSVDIKMPVVSERKRELPKVMILGVGGTILSKVDYITGAVRSVVSADELIQVLPEVNDIAIVDTKIIMNKYSEHLVPEDWEIMCKEVYKAIIKGYDGVVILHGTDTLAYTASALAFALQKPPVPIVLVGSQRSSDRPSSDAALNLISAIYAAAYSEIAEVMVAMHLTTSDRIVALHQATRVRKNHTSRRDAFQSIDVIPYAVIEDGCKIKYLRRDYRKRAESEVPILYPKFSRKAALVKFYPGFHKNILYMLYKDGVKAIILEGTGLGHVGEELYDTLKYLIESGVRIYMASQCIWGRVNMNVYDTGRLLKKIGVIPLENMLSEVAYVKASWIIGNFGVEELDNLMLKNIAGEITYRSPIFDTRGINHVLEIISR